MAVFQNLCIFETDLNMAKDIDLGTEKMRRQTILLPPFPVRADLQSDLSRVLGFAILQR